MLVRGLNKRHRAVEAVRNLDPEVPYSEFFGFCDPDRADKSPTIKILCMLPRPTSGEVPVAGYDIATAHGDVRRLNAGGAGRHES